MSEVKEQSINFFGIRLKKIRLRENITQEELAKYLDVNRMTIVKWEKGTAEPSITHLRRLSHRFSISIAYLVGEDDFTLFLIYTAEIFMKAMKCKNENKSEQYEFSQWIMFWNEIIEKCGIQGEIDKFDRICSNIGYTKECEELALDYPYEYNYQILKYIVNVDFNGFISNDYILPSKICQRALTDRPLLYFFMYGLYPYEHR